MRKIGITLRQSPAPNYDEPRDAIATDWYRLLHELQWDNHWILLPNLGEATLAYALEWGIDALILTGGEDVGTHPERDKAELSLLQHAAIAKWPVLGICRGMQMLQVAAGGELHEVEKKQHVACRHVIQRSHFPWSKKDSLVEVNSFHSKEHIPSEPFYLTVRKYIDYCLDLGASPVIFN